MARPVFTIHEHDIGIPVVVVVDESASRAHRLRQPLLPKGGVVVNELNPRLRSDIAKLDVLGRSTQGRECQSQDEGTSKALLIHELWRSLAGTTRNRGRMGRTRSCLGLRSSQRHRDVLVYRLPFVVVFRMLLPVAARDSLRR